LGRTPRNAKQAAKKRLGIKPGDMDGVPSVTEKIKAGVGSIDRAIQALREDDSEDALAFIQKYDSVSKSDKKFVTLEEIVTASGLTTRRFVEIVTGAIMEQCGDVTKMMVTVAQPEVVKATIKAATDSVPIVATVGNRQRVVGYTNGDTKAMELFHKATGFLPMPKGAVTNINLNQQNNTAQLSSKDDEDDGPEDLQTMDSFLMDMQDVLRPELPAPREEAVPVIVPNIEYIDADV